MRPLFLTLTGASPEPDVFARTWRIALTLFFARMGKGLKNA